MTLDWLIIGGGIHGVHIAVRLLASANVSPGRLRIVDPGQRLLERWRHCTAVTGMDYLRSTGVHHLDIAPASLESFAGQRSGDNEGCFALPFNRPALGLFNEHCEEVMEACGLSALHIQDRATQCSVGCDSVAVRLASDKTIESQNLVLALGAGEQPLRPSWAPQGHPQVHHIFEPGFAGWPQAQETVAVVGGGISAGQVALRLLGEGHRVHLVSRHALRVRQFDSDPGWLGPKHMTGFRRERDFNRRRGMITEARYRGSVPPDVGHALYDAIERGHLSWHQADVEAFENTDLDTSEPETSAPQLSLKLSSGAQLAIDRVLLATGFSSARPGGALVDGLIESACLPCAECGYPIIDSALRWHPRVHVSGALAELELGPAARNIAGARRAGDRLVGVAVAQG